MKTVKYKNIIFTNGYVSALKGLVDQPIGSAKAWSLVKFLKEVEKHSKIFGELRKSLLEKYAKIVDDKWVVNEGSQELIDKEFQELLNIEEEYEVEPIKLDDDIKLSAKDLLVLEDILEQ